MSLTQWPFLVLQTLHRTIEKTHFDPEDAILDQEALVKVAKVNNHDKARKHVCPQRSQQACQESATKIFM